MTTSSSFRDVVMYEPLSLMKPGEDQILTSNLEDAIQRYSTRLATVSRSFESLIGPTDLVIVDALENYLPGTPASWYAIHSTESGSRRLEKYPQWVKDELGQRINDPIIFLEKDHLLVNDASDGTALIMHELAHNLTDSPTAGQRGRWDFWTVEDTPDAWLYGEHHNISPQSFWDSDAMSVKAKSRPIWFEYSADFIADWAYDDLPDAWQHALMKCFVDNTSRSSCEQDFRKQVGRELNRP